MERRGEAERIKQWKDLPNQYLLWHGSKVCNYIGILNLGLRVSGVDAQLTGNSFGDGIYFADKISMSYPYTQDYFYEDDNNGEKYRYALLCEVALGPMQEVYNCGYGQDYGNLIPPYKSLKVVGRL